MNLVSALLASREPVPFRDIVGKVIGYDDPAGEEALEKRFDRDKADLRRLGIPVEYVAPDAGLRGGYVVPPDQVYQQRVTFTPQEHLLLAIAGRVGAAATGGAALEDALKSALRKLAVDLVGPDPLEDMAPVTVLRARTGDPQALDNLQSLSRAVCGNHRVRFTYSGVHAEAAITREVDPYGLGLARGAWYLAGFCHLRSAVRVFKLGRIEGNVTILASDGGPAFHIPSGFRLEDHVGRDAWDLGDSTPRVVRLAAEPGAVTSGLLPGARTVGSHGARILFEVEVRRPLGLVPWLLARGGEVEVVEPEELREAVREEASRLLARYDAPPGSRPSSTTQATTVPTQEVQA